MAKKAGLYLNYKDWRACFAAAGVMVAREIATKHSLATTRIAIKRRDNNPDAINKVDGGFCRRTTS
jgi:hypothetical protein